MADPTPIAPANPIAQLNTQVALQPAPPEEVPEVAAVSDIAAAVETSDQPAPAEPAPKPIAPAKAEALKPKVPKPPSNPTSEVIIAAVMVVLGLIAIAAVAFVDASK